MPAIKKRITAEYMAEQEQQRSEENGGSGGDVEIGEEETPASSQGMKTSPVKRKASSGGHISAMLKGLDGEVILEKRKRTVPAADLKMSSWLENNFEKKPDVHLSSQKLYTFYTDMCQQEGGGVVEFREFNKMVHEKFGKEFGVREDSVYNGLLKEAKARKKPVVLGQTLGLKMKDIVDEALKASGNPTKGVRFHWIKQFISNKYPALQIEQRAGNLRGALERGIRFGKVELVKGIGFCGFYRLPGPSEIEEEDPKEKEKKKKAKAENEEMETDKDAETGDDEGDSASKKPKEAPTKEQEEESAETEGEKSAKAEKKKKAKTRPKRKRTPNSQGSAHHIENVFPLALTYMAEPKEASFAKIRKYLEKYYGKADIESKLKKTLEQGCEYGLWERLSGSGASGTFQLKVDSFNPEHTESLTDMVCSAIIACTEPKVASFQLLKSYIKEHHSEFNIEAKPFLLKKAITRGIKNNIIFQVSGLGMTGSFQLSEPYTPSPSALAGEEDEDESDAEVGKEGDEVYIVRKTKSGRRAPINQYNPTTEGTTSSSRARSKASSAISTNIKPGKRKVSRQLPPKYTDSSEEEENEESDKEAKYESRVTKSGRGKGAPSPQKAAEQKEVSTPVPKKQKSSPLSKASSRRPSVTKNAKKPKPSTLKSPKKPALKASSEEEEEEEEKEEEEDKDISEYIPRPTKSGRISNTSSFTKNVESVVPKKKAAAKKAQPEPESEEENYYEIEEAPAQSKKSKPQKQTPKAGSTVKSSKKQTEAVDSHVPENVAARSPRFPRRL